MKRSTFSSSSHAQGGNMRDGKARSPRTRSNRARSPHGRSTSRGRSPIHRSTLRQRSPNRRRAGRNIPLSNRLSIGRPGGGNAMRGRRRASLLARRRNKKSNWKQNKKNRRRGRAVAARNAQGSYSNAARMRMDDYMLPRTNRGRQAQKDLDIDRAVARARRESSARTRDIFWTKKLLDAEQTLPSSTKSRRWVHSGFKEMYKEELGYSDAEQPDRALLKDRRRSDVRIRRQVASPDKRPSPVHSKRKASRSPVRKGRKKIRQKSKSPRQKESRSPQKSNLVHSRQRSLSRSPSSNSSISSSSFSGSYSSYSRSSSRSSLSGTSSVSSISFEKRKKASPSTKRVPRSKQPVQKVAPARIPQEKVAPKAVTMRIEDASEVDGHYRRSPYTRAADEPSKAMGSKHYDRDEISRHSPEDNHYGEGEKNVYSKPLFSGVEDTDSVSSSDDDGPRKMTLSERFGKLAQLSSQRQEYEGIRMKIVREGGQDKKVYLEARATKSRSLSPRKSRSKGAHEKWLREHKAEYDDYEKRYGEFRQWNPHRDLPSELPPNWDDVNVRYRYYKESGYFGDRSISKEDYLKWEQWWYRYRDWLEKYSGSRDRDTRNSSMAYDAARMPSSLWSRSKEDRKRRRY